MEDQYVSFDVAKLLSEHGFDEPCKTSYSKLDKKLEETAISDWGKVNQYKAPTQALAMRWLREVHLIYFTFRIVLGEIEEDKGYFQIGINVKTDLDTYTWKKWIYGNSYEDTYEAAMKYCLENIL